MYGLAGRLLTGFGQGVRRLAPKPRFAPASLIDTATNPKTYQGLAQSASDTLGRGIGGPNAQVLINNNDDFSRFIILIWQLYAGFEVLNKDFITTAFSFVSDDGTI